MRIAGKKRIEILDNLRGITILLVVIGHTLQGAYIEFDNNLWFRILYSFHMPLFMFISGATASLGIQSIFSENNHGIIPVCKLEIQGLYRKAQRLVLPFLTWGVISYYYRDGAGAKNLQEYIGYLINHPDVGLWFLPALFWCFVLLASVAISSYCIFRISAKKYTSLIIGIIVSIGILHFLPNLLALYLTKIYYGYFVMGLAWIFVLDGKFPRFTKEVACLGYLALFPLYHRVDTSRVIESLGRLTGMHTMQEAYLFILAACGIITIIGLVEKFQHVMSTTIEKVLFLCSTRSLDIYAIHFYFLGYFSGVMSFFFAVSASLVTSIIIRQSHIIEFLMFGEIPKKSTT